MRMNKKLLVAAVLAGLLAGCATTRNSQPEQRLHHLVIIWLKHAGDANARQRYIDESKVLAKLPGVLAYDLGTPAMIKRSHASVALDESYDVAVSAVYESPEAFAAFLQDPEYQRIAKEVLRPLVDKYKVYDFVE